MVSADTMGNIKVVILKKTQGAICQVLPLASFICKDTVGWRLVELPSLDTWEGRILACKLLPSPARSKGHRQPSKAVQLGGRSLPSAHPLRAQVAEEGSVQRPVLLRSLFLGV